MKKNFKFLAMLAIAAVAFTSCKEDDETIVPPTSEDTCDVTAADFTASFEANGNSVAQLSLSASVLAPSNDLGVATPATDMWFDQVTYKGAFDGNADWTAGWTALSGYVPLTVAVNEVQVVDNTGEGTTTWTKDNVYIIEGFVFVESGDTLIIEAGTVIKGKSGSGENASALIVARGGTIMANGTATEPIIMTFENDNLSAAPSASVKSEWGGLIILGNARLNSAPGESAIEGIPTTEVRGLYGGNDDEDNSGVLKYVSIRHGGTDIGAANEINGLTLGGVGSETVIDHVEVFANKDDGIEFFGGTARVKHAVVAYVGDDAFDYDEGYRGFGQFWLSVQLVAEGDRGGEHDGGTNPESAEPYAVPTIYNATYIGNGNERALTFRDNAGGKYYNSIFHNWDKGVDVEDYVSEGETNSLDRFCEGDLVIEGSVFSSIGAGATAEAIFTVTEN